MTKPKVSQKKTTKKTTKRARPVCKAALKTATPDVAATPESPQETRVQPRVHVPSGEFDGMWYPGDNTNRGRLDNGQIVFLFENKQDTFSAYLHVDNDDALYITVSKDQVDNICDCPLLHIRLLDDTHLRHLAAQLTEWADDLAAPDIWERG
jgi:hypothetical protein